MRGRGRRGSIILFRLLRRGDVFARFLVLRFYYSKLLFIPDIRFYFICLLAGLIESEYFCN